MYKTEKTFQQAGVLGPGELVVKVPGTNFRMPYSSGEAFVSEDVGYVALNIADLVAESTGDAPNIDFEKEPKLKKEFFPWMYMGQSGKDLAAKLNNQSEGKEILRKLKSDRLYLAYSNFDGHEALTIPGTAVHILNAAIDEINFYRLDVALYDILFMIELGVEQRLHNTLAFHSTALAGLEPNLNPVDKETLENGVLQLVSKANRVYDSSHSPADRRISQN